MVRQTRRLLVCCGFLIATGLPDADAGEPPLDFGEALAMAYDSNPRLLAARRELNQTDENVPQALAGWRPRVSLSGTVGGSLFDDNMDPTHDPERRMPQDYALQLRQNLYTSGQIHAQVQQAESQVRAERASLRSTEAEVLLAAGQAYLDVIRDRRIVELNRNQVAVQAATLQASSVELAAGGVAAADLGQARARLATAQAQLATAEGVASQSEAAFEHQVGQAPGPLAPPVVAVPQPPTRERAIAEALTGNPEVAQAQSALEASRHGVDVERAGLLPHLALNVQLERVRDTEIQKLNQRDNVLQGTVELTVPLYQGGGQYSRIRQAKEASWRLDDLLTEATRQARQLASDAWDQLVAARKRIAAQHDAISGNAAAVRGYTVQQRAGVRTLLDVLITQQDLLSSEVAEVTAEHDLLLSRLQLASALGELDAAHLQLPTSPYDPARHYDQVRDKWIGTTPPPP